MQTIARSVRRTLSFTPLRTLVNHYRHRGFDAADVFLGSYPKSGSTWLRSMLTTLLLERCDDWESVKDLSRIVGRHFDAPRHLPNNGRLIKTHERFSPHYRKSILMIRDGRDNAVSLFFYSNRHRSPDELKDPALFAKFVDQFLCGKASPYGGWNEHVLSWYAGANAPDNQMAIIRYEDCKADPFSELKRVTEFLGVQASDDQIRSAVEQNDIKAMRERERKIDDSPVKRDYKIPFVRQGIVGGWKQYFTPELEAKFLDEARQGMLAGGYLGDSNPRATEMAHDPTRVDSE